MIAYDKKPKLDMSTFRGIVLIILAISFFVFVTFFGRIPALRYGKDLIVINYRTEVNERRHQTYANRYLAPVTMDSSSTSAVSARSKVNGWEAVILSVQLLPLSYP